MSHIKTAVIVLITAMILSLVLSYASIMTIVQTTKSNTERVLNSFVIENATYIFSSIKNGNDFTSSISSSYFVYITTHWTMTEIIFIIEIMKVHITSE